MVLPLWKVIADSLRADIESGRLVAGELLPPEIDIAARFAVSHMTANRALSELQQEGIVVRRRRTGTVVAERRIQKTGRIAVFLHTRDYLEQEFLTGIRAGLPDELDLVLCDIQCDPEREAQYLLRMQRSVDGILIIPTCNPANNTVLNMLISQGTCIVCMDMKPACEPMDAVTTDNYQGARRGLEHAVSLGHQCIAHFTGTRPHGSSIADRMTAYNDVMALQGAADASRWVREFAIDFAQRPAVIKPSVKEAMSDLLHLPAPDRPTCFFCAHDYLLSAAVSAYRALDPTLTAGVEIVAFNDCPPLIPHLPSNVHRIVQRAYDVGKLAAERLVLRMAGNAPGPAIQVTPDFYPAPGERSSVDDVGVFRRMVLIQS